jgi:aldehyde dehydrogenase (NAD+)
MFEHTALSDSAKALVAGVETLRAEGWLLAGAPEPLDVVEPGTGRAVGSVPTSDRADVTRAVAASRAALEGDWGRFSPADRGRVLHRLADLVEAHREDFAQLAVLEVGTPITTSRGLHAAFPAMYFRWWAEQAVTGPPGGYEESLGLAEAPGPGGAPVMAMSLLRREPLGVVAAVVPYNAPLLIASFKVGGALAAGCTCVLLPSVRAPLFSVALLNLAREAGIPAGVLGVVVGDAEVGQALTTEPGVDMVSFTGSVGVGRLVGAQASGTLKKVVLELGGKSPNVLLPSARVEDTVAASSLRYLRNSGQGCGATTRTIVPRELQDAYVDATATFFDTLVVGDPWDPTSDLGPLIRGEHRDRVQGYVDRAIDGGAVLAAGGGKPELAEGYYMNPALISGVTNDSEICQEELFGPVGALVVYDDVEEALAIANDTRFVTTTTGRRPLACAMSCASRPARISESPVAWRRCCHWPRPGARPGCLWRPLRTSLLPAGSFGRARCADVARCGRPAVRACVRDEPRRDHTQARGPTRSTRWQCRAVAS